ncbi:MAG: hypothetical protein NT066_03885 [Candidatus Omnitrophica bacterium]|nr:hypothetical protein [Candidatus Omnitrophota bacterium]
MKKRRFHIPVKLVSAIVIIFLALVFIIGYSLRAIRDSDYFNIKEIIANEGNAVDLSYLKGNNIFSVDLINESRNILDAYPGYSLIKLVRILPNRIFANFIKRKPVALVKLYRYFALDEGGVFFDLVNQQIEGLSLPVIVGLETKIFGARPGKAYNIRELVLALHIIKEIKRDRLLKDYRIKKINVANIANTSMFMLYPPLSQDTRSAKVSGAPGELEVRLGKDKIKDKIAILAGLVMGSSNDLANIKYIDLRFKEAVIKLKDVK